MKRLSKLYLRAGVKIEPVGSVLMLYASTILYFTRLPNTQALAIMLLTIVGVLMALGIWLGPHRLNRDRLGLIFSGRIKDGAVGFMLAFLGWWLYSEYLHLTRGYRLAIGWGQSSSLLLTIVCIATAEELFFRSYTHARLLAWSSPLGRIIAVSAILGVYKSLVHFWEWRPILYHIELFLLTFTLSVLLSIWREISGSIAGPLVTHIVWDLLVYGTLGSIPDWIF